MNRHPKPIAIGPLSSRSAAMRHHIQPSANFAHPDKWCNSMMDNLKPEDAASLPMFAPPARPGSTDAFSLKSVGRGC